MTLTNYTIKQTIGQGGMATVYLAEHTILQKSVAIKILNKEYVHNDNIRKRFLAEARNLFGMSHPNIIKVTDLIDHGDTVAFVMEYIDGETLKEYLDKKGKLSEKKIKEIFSQMLEAVGYVHEQGLIHRDIKPSNFMIAPKGQIKLLDFGIAKNTDTQSADYTQTGTMQNMGTPMYMSPEQIKSTKDVTLQSDIYSLGVVLWQMVMGKKPYDTNTTSTFELQTKIVTEKLSLTNSSFDGIIGVATEKEVSKRFKNCKTIKSKLDNLQKQDSDNTKAYTTQDSEKTIVDNSNEKTVVETQEKNNYTPKSQINIPYIPTKKDNNSNVGYIVLVIIVLIILGVIISNKNQAYESEPYDYGIDSTAVVDTTATEVPAEAVETKIVTFKNNSRYSVDLAWAYFNNGTWESHGWYNIKSNSSIDLTLPSTLQDDSIYWYAVNVNDEKYEGTDGYFCVSHPNAFEYYDNKNCNEQAGFYKLMLDGNLTIQQLN
jgi:serine/threonine protein kinase